jgi:hypothetical protein
MASELLNVPGSTTDGMHRVSNAPGYSTPVFKDKEAQFQSVLQGVISKVLLFPWAMIASPN